MLRKGAQARQNHRGNEPRLPLRPPSAMRPRRHKNKHNRHKGRPQSTANKGDPSGLPTNTHYVEGGRGSHETTGGTSGGIDAATVGA